MSGDCCVALPRGAMGLQFVIVVFPDHNHLLFLCLKYNQTLNVGVCTLTSLKKKNVTERKLSEYDQALRL